MPKKSKSRIDKDLIDEVMETARNTRGLREVLFEELDRLRKGEITRKRAQVICRLSDSILATVKIEMDAFRHPLSREFAALPSHPSLDQ